MSSAGKKTSIEFQFRLKIANLKMQQWKVIFCLKRIKKRQKLAYDINITFIINLQILYDFMQIYYLNFIRNHKKF